MARPLSRPGLGSTTRRELCWWLAQGCTKEEAAKKAGLPNSDRTHAFARTIQFAEELREAMRDHLSLNLAPKAVAILKEVMEDKAVQPRVRIDACRYILDRAGYSASEEQKKVLSPDDIESMTIEELQQFVLAGKRTIDGIVGRRAEGAKLVESPPSEGVLS